MSMMEMTIEQFLRELASDSPAPGGGSVAALGGALGAALVSMVARLTRKGKIQRRMGIDGGIGRKG